MYRIYTITDGEDMESIARKFLTTPEELMEINGFDREYRINTGNMMIVPNNNKIFQNYLVKKGDTIYEIANRVGTDVDTLLKVNGLDEDDYIYPDENILIPNSNILIYVTSDSDSLSDVASKFKTSREKLVVANENIVLASNQLLFYKK